MYLFLISIWDLLKSILTPTGWIYCTLFRVALFYYDSLINYKNKFRNNDDKTHVGMRSSLDNGVRWSPAVAPECAPSCILMIWSPIPSDSILLLTQPQGRSRALRYIYIYIFFCIQEGDSCIVLVPLGEPHHSSSGGVVGYGQWGRRRAINKVRLIKWLKFWPSTGGYDSCMC